MNKSIANIIFIICLVASLIVTYASYDNAAQLAFSGNQPHVWLSVLGFFGAIALVIVGIFIKTKYGTK